MAMPGSSWVAKWNGLEGKKPGIYAINILEDAMEDVDDYEYEPKKKSGRRTRREQTWSSDEDFL